jgi:hypothetical protein
MATTHKPYSQFVVRQMNGNALDWDAATIHVTLHTAASNALTAIDTADFFDDITNEVAAGGGYVAGGFVIPTRAVSFDSGTRQVRLTGGVVTVDPITVAAFRHIVLRSVGGSAATSPVISVVSFDADQSVDGELTLTPDATGYGRFTVPA